MWKKWPVSQNLWPLVYIMTNIFGLGQRFDSKCPLFTSQYSFSRGRQWAAKSQRTVGTRTSTIQNDAFCFSRTAVLLSLRSFIESKDIKMQKELSQLGGPQRRHPHCRSYAQTSRQTTIGWSEREWIAIRENIWSFFSCPVLCDKFIKQGKWKCYCDCALIHVSHEHASVAPKEAFSQQYVVRGDNRVPATDNELPDIASLGDFNPWIAARGRL